jgi:regulatory protein
MVEILNIVERPTHAEVLLSTGERLKLPPDAPGQFALSKGKSIDRTAYEALKEDAERYGCMQKALAYLAIRGRSAREMELYLLRKGFGPDHVREAMHGLREHGYIDDRAFAVHYINARKGKKTVGRHLLKRELFRKGVARDTVREAMSEAQAEVDDREKLYELAIARMKRLEGKKNRTAKLVYFLAGRGFGEADVRAVIERLRKEGHDL